MNVHPEARVCHAFMIFYTLNAKNIARQNSKFQIYTLKLNATFCHYKNHIISEQGCTVGQLLIEIVGIKTRLIWHCLWSTVGSRRNDCIKALASLGVWLHHSPWALGCFANNTRASPAIIPWILPDCQVPHCIDCLRWQYATCHDNFEGNYMLNIFFVFCLNM